MTSARGVARAAASLPGPDVEDLDALDRRIFCPHCRQPYEVVGEFEERRIQPTHKTWCQRYRPTILDRKSVV